MRPGKTPLWAIGLVVLCTFLTTSSQVLMKRALNSSPSLSELVANPLLLAGLALLLLGGVAMVWAFRHGELSVLHPVLALGFVWVLLASGLVGEVPHPAQYLGVAGIVAGVALISHSRGRG